MSKKSRKGLILLAGVLSFSALGLASCGEKTPTPVEPDHPDQPEVEKITKVTITNKAALQAAWKVGEADRTIEFTVAPSTIKTDDPRITITSSAPDIIKVEGRTLKAVKAGRADITVKAGDVKDTVKIIVDPADVIVTAIAIKNKADFTGAWHVGDANRALTIETTPKTNITQLIKDGLITVESSDEKVLTAAGPIITATGVGTATVTVKYTKGETTFKDDVEMTVVELPAMTVKEAFTHAFPAIQKHKGETKTAYKINALAVATNKDEDAVIWDGENYAAVRGAAAKTLEIGKAYEVQGKINNYNGLFQIKAGETSLKLLEDTTITPEKEYTKFGFDALKAYKDNAVKTSSSYSDASQIYYPLAGTIEARFVSIREDKNYYYCEPILAEGDAWTEGDYIKVDGDYVNEVFEQTKDVKEMRLGSKVLIEGLVTQYNGHSKYFNIIPTHVKETEAPVAPKTIEAVVPTSLKQMEQIDVTKMYKFDNPLAAAKVDWDIKDADHILLRDWNRILPTKAGKFTVQAIANKGQENEIKSAVVEITVTDEVATNALTAARTKVTAEEINALEAGKDTAKLYELEGQITYVKSGDKYGNITIKDSTGEFKPYGTTLDLNSIVLDKDGKIADYKNPAKFDKSFGPGKAYELGDTVKVAVFKDEFRGDNSFKAILLSVTKDAQEGTYPITLPTGVTADKEGKEFAYGTELVLTLGDTVKDKDLAVNGTVIDPQADGTYKVKVMPMKTVVTLEDKWSMPEGALSFTTFNSKGDNSIKGTHFTLKSVSKKSGGVAITSVETPEKPKVYNEAKGLKFSSSSDNGTITLKYASKMDVKKLVLNAEQFNANEKTTLTITVGTAEAKTLEIKEAKDYVIEFTTAVNTDTIVIAASKRNYVASIAIF